VNLLQILFFIPLLSSKLPAFVYSFFRSLNTFNLQIIDLNFKIFNIGNQIKLEEP